MASISSIPSAQASTPKLARRRRFLGAIALLGITFLAYFPALSAGFIWDDNSYITENINLRTLWGLGRIWTVIGAVPQYYPLTHTTFWIEYHLWKLHPLGYHLDNILLQAAGAILLWILLRRMGICGAWIVAAIFAIHPIQTESVAWVTERKNVLSGVFFFLCLLTYPSTRLDPNRSLKLSRYFLALGLFMLALLSKSVTSSLPAVILVLIWWRQGRITAKDFLPLIPFFILAVAMGTLTGWMERNIVGAVGPDFNFSAIDRCVIAGRALWFYAVKLFWPHPLAFIYPHWNLDWKKRPWLLLFPISAVTVIAALWLLRRRLGRGPLAAVLLFCGTLFPALGFVNVFPMQYSFVADHFQYLAGIPLIALIVGVVTHALRRCGALGIAGPLLCVIVILCLSILTWQQSRIYHDKGTLWRDTLITNPDSYMVHANYGAYLQDIGQIDQAIIEYKRSIALRPNNSPAYVFLGVISDARGDYPQAIYWYNLALQSVPDSLPTALHQLRYLPYYDLGVVYGQMANVKPSPNRDVIDADRKKSEEYYLKALQIEPDAEAVLENLGILLGAEGNRNEEALKYFQHAIASNPSSGRAHNFLGDFLRNTGDLAGAAHEYQIAQQLDARASEQ